MAITYNAGTNTITVTAYTEAVPCTFLDIYNADVAGGWGVVTRQCTKQFCISAHLEIGDDSTVTWFADTLKQIFISTASGKLEVKLNSTFRLGNKDGNSNVYDGCYLYLDDPYFHSFSRYGSTGDVKLYDTIIYWDGFFRIYRGNDQLVEIDGCRFIKWQGGRFQGTNSYLKNSTFHDVTVYGLTTKATSPTIENIRVTRSYCGFYCNAKYGPNPILKNLVSKNNTYGVYVALEGVGLQANPILINPDFDTWNIFFDAGASYCDLWRKYEFDLKVQDKDETAINGAAVKIWDKDNNLIVDLTTGADGTIATQILNYGYYDEAGGDTPVMQTPHIIQISKAGYETYKKKWTIDKKTDWTIALHIPKRRFDSLEG